MIKARDAKALEPGDARRSEMEGWSEIFQKKNEILPRVNHPAVRSPFRLLNKNTIDVVAAITNIYFSQSGEGESNVRALADLVSASWRAVALVCPHVVEGALTPLMRVPPVT